MQLPDSRAATPPLPWRRLARFAATGAGCAVLAFVLGRAAEVAVLGWDEASARARVERDVRASFDAMARALRVMALGMADPASVVAAASGDAMAARRLFEAADAALAQAQTAGYAVTAYAADGRALAWEGRPSELPLDRLLGEEAWFFARSALGLRLVYVTPVMTGSGERVGAVAAERPLDMAPGRAQTDAFRFPSRIAPVSLELGFESARTQPDASAFTVSMPTGARLLTATLDSADLQHMRSRWRRASRSLALIVLAASLVLLCGPLLDWRHRARRARPYMTSIALTAAVIIGSRLLMRLASPADWSGASVFSGVEFASPFLRPLLTSPFDFLLTAVAASGLTGLLLYAVEAWRLTRRHRRHRVNTARTAVLFVAMQLGAGGALAALLSAYHAFLSDTVANTTLDLLHYSLHPWSTPRLALQVGLVVSHATTLVTAVMLLRAALVPWSVSRFDWRLRGATIVLWAAPLAGWQLLMGFDVSRQRPILIALAVIIGCVIFAGRGIARYRHGSQAFRLTLMTLGLVLPAVAFYPTIFELALRAKSQLVESRFAPQAINHRQTIQRLLQNSLDEIDAFPGLPELVSVPVSPSGAESSTDRAYQVWRITGLATYPVTSSVELYDADGVLVSRFAFNLPDDLTAVPRSDEQSCAWGVFEEVSPFFAEERRILHAGRALCDDAGRHTGSIIVHAMLSDYANLPFILSQSPYVAMMRPADPLQGEGVSGRDVEFAVYGWSRRPLYASGVTAWPLDDAVFARIEESRQPLWAELRRGDVAYAAYVLNDRGGIYALGFPIASPLDHLVNIAEIMVLAFGTYTLLLGATALFGVLTRRGTTARALLREIRASFYRKLLLAFIAATMVPVAALALATRTYVADQMRGNVEQEAIFTASAARRVVEDLVAPRAAQERVGVDDNLMVWVSRLIDQDVNIFIGPRLIATSERNLFASGLLPTRTPADVYRALDLRHDAATVVREQIGTLSYLVAGISIESRSLNAMLTMPLTSRELQIEDQIDTLDRRVLLGALLFMFAGAGLGYWLAERIADPVSRLSRATRRIGRGDLDARIVARSSDELRRLVDDFNRMATELQSQQKELERTHRLEAWAEMARQVAHEIKNPLTPIQLNAEHLRRVHADRGQPLSPILEECVATILTQVKLLRQIASEFSNFASSPAARPAAVSVRELVQHAIDPYRAGLEGRISVALTVPDDLPQVYVDRTLIARSLTNIVENAIYAMPGAGTLTIDAQAGESAVRIRVADTGAGMDPEALARAFEPYFSTKTTGTGLGLPIAKRNVELSGGSIAVTSERNRGTTVELTLPVAGTRT